MKNILIIVSLIFLTSCGNSQTREEIFVEISQPNDVGVNQEKINNLFSNIETDKIKNIHSIIIIKDDKLIAEKYFDNFDRNKLHYSASVSKSFASVLLGIAIDKGFFDEDIQAVLNMNVSELFPEYNEIIKKDTLKNELKLKHILSMTAGFDWDEHTYPYTDNRNDCNRINNNEEPMKFLFERRLLQNPGEQFYYNGGLSLSISYLIEKKTGMSVDKFAEKYLFKPLGIENYRWDKVENGLIDTDGGLHLAPIDQAKLGYLFLKEGTWKNEQIVSKEWVNETTKVHHKNNGMPDYGYQWWCGNYYTLNQTSFIFFASGHGGQKIIVLPEFDMVVVITQQVFDNPYGDLNFLVVMSEYILPAVYNQKNKSINKNIFQSELAKYEGHYKSEYNNEELDIVTIKNGLLVTSINGERYEFYPIDTNIFEARILELLTIDIEFLLDEKQNVESLKSSFGFRNDKFIKTKNR